MNGHAKPEVLVLGGGFAGLESAFYLRMKLGRRANITLVSDEERFLFKPNTIYIPFGLDPDSLTIPLERPTARQGIRFVHDRAEGIDPQRHVVQTRGGTLPYDYLVVATGARMRPEEVPGMTEYAQSIFTPAEMLRLRTALNKLYADARRGAERKVLFLVPPDNKCSGPLYEMVFMLDSHLRKLGLRGKVEVAYTTYEGGYIQAFGPRLNTYVEDEFARRRIDGRRAQAVTRIGAGSVDFANGTAQPYDLLVSFPPYVAAQPFPGLPADERGFLATELTSRRVTGLADVFAPGDAGDFPVKQAYLAFLQADAVAGHIAAMVDGTEPAVAFEPTSMCVMEQFDRATFAQVPLRLTGDPARPVAVREDAAGLYKLGSGKLWRLGKKLLGVYLPWRFGAGKPFHAGLPWQAMELGLKGMSALLAK